MSLNASLMVAAAYSSSHASCHWLLSIIIDFVKLYRKLALKQLEPTIAAHTNPSWSRNFSFLKRLSHDHLEVNVQELTSRCQNEGE